MKLKPFGSVYERAAAALLLACSLLAVSPAAPAQNGDSVVEAREALRKGDRARLAAARVAALAGQHPLAMWADYWDLSSRLNTAQQADLSAFYLRWSGTYVEDRLRNDWLLELGRRRDWGNFRVDFARFRMNDDREVTCYATLADHLSGQEVRDRARAAWFAQRDGDEGCALMASTLYEAKVLSEQDALRKARFAIDQNRPRVARHAVGLIDPGAVSSVQDLVDNPARFMKRQASAADRLGAELTTMALTRLAANDPDAAAQALSDGWEPKLPPSLRSWAWSTIAKQSAMKLQPNAADLYQRAELTSGPVEPKIDWPDETLAWKVRAALRADNGKPRWQQIVQAINAMTPDEQRDPAWVYWKARALQAVAVDSQESEALRAQAQEMLLGIAGQYHFYGSMAAETIGQPLTMPPRPQPLTDEEQATAAQNPGLSRALQLISLGLRNEGVREWNYSLRGMNDRELLAAAKLACDRQVWDRCINTSDRTRTEIDMEQRFPTPFRREVLARANEIGLDPAYVYGLIRQESRFITDARSYVGASGLMQIMPATARWTAKKLGLDYTREQINDRDINLKLGTGYLKLVLDDFDGSQAMAAAAYNAGPGRPRRWREGPPLEAAAWAENIPFAETRDYVKKVLSNATFYAALLTGGAPTLKPRLGSMIGPRDTREPPPNPELP